MSAALPDARAIQVRMLYLLLRAFLIVAALVNLLLVGLSVLFFATVGRDSLPLSPITPEVFESYYLANGSWEGVERLPHAIYTPGDISVGEEWDSLILLDAEENVLIYRGVDATTLDPFTMEIGGEAPAVPLIVGGQPVGALLVGIPTQTLRIRVIGPIGLISFFLALLTLLIGLLLSRRVVNPLADVIAAAQAVAKGQLNARVEVRGPDDLRALTDNFNHMAEVLERSDRQRRELLADIAHELRTPLTIIQGRLEGIMDGVYPAEAGQIAPALYETYLLERLIEDLRLLTLAEARQIQLDLRPVSLVEIAERAMQLAEADLADREIRIEMEGDIDLPPALADEQRVLQVLSNLLNNAARYGREGGLVRIRLRRLAEAAEVAVLDQGPGLPEEALALIFRRFWRGDRARSRSSGGTGLGLAIARELVEAQGGQISASNQPEGGLCVAFTLPLAPS